MSAGEVLAARAWIPRGEGGEERGRVEAILCHYHNAAAELRSCLKVEVAVLGSPSLIVLISGCCGR